MKAEHLYAILDALKAHGLVVQQLHKNLWLVPVPEVLTKIWTVNADGFTPHEMRDEIKVARCVLLGWGKHDEPDLSWKPTGAVYWVIDSDYDLVAAFKDVGYDVMPALKDIGVE